MVRPVADPTKPGITLEANRCRCPETVLPGRLPTAMDLVKIMHLLAAVAPARVDFLARHLDQPSNRLVPRGTGVTDPGAAWPAASPVFTLPGCARAGLPRFG
jgi:hypothetical protein